MKISIITFIVIAVFIIFAIRTFGTGSASKNEKGIFFHKGSWNEALELAKKENKLIFLDISASWCGPCKLLKARTFPNSKVGEFYNSNFISVAVDGEIGEGIELARKYGIRAYPTLLFVNGRGKIVVQTAGYHGPKQIIELGKKVIQKQL